MEGMKLPPFPVDDATLDLLARAVDPWAAGDTEAERSSLGDFLTMMSQLGGSDTAAVAEESDGVVEMRDPMYSTHDVIGALIAEVQRLRLGVTTGGGPVEAGRWLRRHTPHYAPGPLHRCEPPMKNDGRVADGEHGFLWRCDCGKLWEVNAHPLSTDPAYTTPFPSWQRAGWLTRIQYRRKG